MSDMPNFVSGALVLLPHLIKHDPAVPRLLRSRVDQPSQLVASGFDDRSPVQSGSYRRVKELRKSGLPSLDSKGDGHAWSCP